MSLRDLPLARRYRGSEDDLLGQLYVPCLSQSVRYSRAVGYFSASALSLAARGLGPFIRQGGEMRLIASPDLTGVDPELINEALAERERVIGDTMTGTLIAGASSGATRQRLGLLGWLVAKRRLDLKVAVVDSGGEAGIYHEKLGLFEDSEGNTVAFHCSANESRGALLLNFESVLVFRSWIEHEADDVRTFTEDFVALWEDRTPGLRIFEFPEATRRELVSMAPDDLPDEEPPTPAQTDDPSERNLVVGAEPTTPRLPDGLDLRSYQREALRTWFSSEGRGILEMATGTGKTVTALSAVERLYSAAHERERSLFVLVVCPYQHLVTQWAHEAERFGVQPILCYRSRSVWFSALTAALQALNQSAVPFHLAIATNATFQTGAFQGVLRGMPQHSLIIADEVHNLGAAGLRQALPDEADYRMGLSATPERHFDPEGSEALEEYFGPVVFRFGLEEAIAAGALTQYDYDVSVVELTGDELDRYLELTHAIARALGSGGIDDFGGGAKHLLIARARVLANASGKLPALRHAIAPFQESTHNLVYCGDGSPQHDTGIEATRQIESAVMLLGRGLGMRVQPYTSETAIDDREQFRARFDKGDLQALVAIRCLDEGVDIPATRRAFILASSTNPRQFIQRRGRVLRPSPDTGKEAAYIHDFLAVPPADSIDDEIKDTERRLVARELERVIRFAELARNGPSAIEKLSDLRDRYELLHL